MWLDFLTFSLAKGRRKAPLHCINNSKLEPYRNRREEKERSGRNN
jgi:hypothetical protein